MNTGKTLYYNIIVVSLFAFLLGGCGGKHNQNRNKSGFELKGKLDFSNGEELYLEEMGPQGIHVIDTASINTNGEFDFANCNPAPGFYRVRISEANFVVLVLDSTQKVFLKGDARNLGNSYSVEGSEDSRLFKMVNTTVRLSYQKRDSIMRSAQTLANLSGNDKSKIKEYADKADDAYVLEAKLQ